jgi:hypothetical protein
MAIVKYFLRNTQTNAGTGGIGYDLSTTQGTSTTLTTATIASDVFAERFFWQVTVNGTPTATTFPTSLSISALNGSVIYRWRVQRVDSGNNIIASSAYSATGTTTGTQTATLTLSQTWASGDRFRLSFEIARVTGAHGNVSVTLNVNNANSFVDIDKTVDLVDTSRFLLMF